MIPKILQYFRESFARKKARRIPQEYPIKIDQFEIDGMGNIDFANWLNPLVPKVHIDSNKIDFFRQYIKPGDLVIDIGANIGDLTVPMAICAEKQGLVLAFDPNPYVYKVLEKNASLNLEKQNIETHLLAIANTEQDYFYISSEASFGNGAISLSKKSRHGKFVYPEPIKGVKLEDFLEKNYPHWIQKLSLIKIDTEGYDKEIIKSIKSLILRCKPVLIAESFVKFSDKEKLELYGVMANNGYEIFYFEDFYKTAKVEKLNQPQDILKYTNSIDLLAIPKK